MSKNELDEDLEAKLNRFEEALGSIEAKVAPFLKKPVNEMVPRLTPTENAKLNMSYSYALNALYYMLLKCQGVSPNDHPVKKDLDRIKRYMAKTSAVDKTIKAKTAAEQTKGEANDGASEVQTKDTGKGKPKNSSNAKASSSSASPAAKRKQPTQPSAKKKPKKKKRRKK